MNKLFKHFLKICIPLCLDKLVILFTIKAINAFKYFALTSQVIILQTPPKQQKTTKAFGKHLNKTWRSLPKRRGTSTFQTTPESRNRIIPPYCLNGKGRSFHLAEMEFNSYPFSSGRELCSYKCAPRKLLRRKKDDSGKTLFQNVTPFPSRLQRESIVLCAN
ncbi:hypothetical protein AVEN_171255-1 [Araneus ventricosus]|uniref:Uncharacterized protein n=1 Tax=Araneus ventricosus TaxID=182803 RepID=A0A4Y2UHS4_ARAVE|nr:hypothetical protein AVEN_190621-1 [Araneus ventricosus]GBO11176.1 hypothetical protein AVEN_85955-1 [Araneus ventricosus]GBO11177.1 hypothetical protein AVEN_171255-1 [Araneus ventricosus]